MNIKDKKKRLLFILNGINEGQSLQEIGTLLGISKQAVSTFLNRNWNKKNGNFISKTK